MKCEAEQAVHSEAASRALRQLHTARQHAMKCEAEQAAQSEAAWRVNAPATAVDTDAKGSTIGCLSGGTVLS